MDAFDLWEDRPPGIPCTQNTSNGTFENGELSYDNNHLFCVNIQMNENDFQIMRNESRFGPDIYDNEGNTACAVLLQYATQCDVVHAAARQTDQTVVLQSIDETERLQ